MLCAFRREEQQAAATAAATAAAAAAAAPALPPRPEEELLPPREGAAAVPGRAGEGAAVQSRGGSRRSAKPGGRAEPGNRSGLGRIRDQDWAAGSEQRVRWTLGGVPGPPPGRTRGEGGSGHWRGRREPGEGRAGSEARAEPRPRAEEAALLPAGRRSSRRPPEGAAGPVSAAPPPPGRRPPALSLARLPGGRGGGAGGAGPPARGEGGGSRRGRASAPGSSVRFGVAGRWRPRWPGWVARGWGAGRFFPAARPPRRAGTASGARVGGRRESGSGPRGRCGRCSPGPAAAAWRPGPRRVAEAGGTGWGEAGGGDCGACPLPRPRAPFTRPSSSPALQPGASPGRALGEEEFFLGPGWGKEAGASCTRELGAASSLSRGQGRAHAAESGCKGWGWGYGEGEGSPLTPTYPSHRLGSRGSR